MAQISKNRDPVGSPTLKISTGYNPTENPGIMTSQSKIKDDSGMSASNTQAKASWASGVPSKKGNKPQ